MGGDDIVFLSTYSRTYSHEGDTSEGVLQQQEEAGKLDLHTHYMSKFIRIPPTGVEKKTIIMDCFRYL